MDERTPQSAPVIEPGHTFATVTDKISSIVLTRPTSNGWFVGFGLAFLVFMGGLYAIAYLFVKGVGIWGINIPVGWGFAIINFVWWIGIGHAGTLISAILLLLRQEWRTSISRLAESMTLFAVACAGLFPVLHLGRPWLLYWLVPYPNVMKVWPQFRSPLVWDVFAVSTYATVSLLFWFIGLIPDLATLRDRTQNPWARIVYGILAMGWRGSAVHWHRYETAYLLLAGLATPLVVSTTEPHLKNMAKILLATGLMVAYGYGMEAFMAWYSDNPFEAYVAFNRAFGPYAWAYWLLIGCNVLTPQLLWVKALRTNVW